MFHQTFVRVNLNIKSFKVHGIAGVNISRSDSNNVSEFYSLSVLVILEVFSSGSFPLENVMFELTSCRSLLYGN